MKIDSIISGISLISWRRRYALWATKGAPLTDLVELDDAPKDSDTCKSGIRDFSISLMSWVKRAPNLLPTPVIGWKRRGDIPQLFIGIGGETLVEKEEWLEIIKEEIEDGYGVPMGLKESPRKKGKSGKRTELSKLMDVTLKAEESLDRAFIYPFQIVESESVAIGEVVVELDLHALDLEAGSIRRLDAHELIHLTNETWDQVPYVRLAKTDNILTDAEQCQLLGVWDDSPTQLLLRPPAGTSVPERGWMHVLDDGTRALIRRKRIFNSVTRFGQHLDFGRLRSEEKMPDDWPLPSNGPVHVLVGPPGTGKTYQACRIVEWILSNQPGARILVCAKEHHALDHLVLNLVPVVEELGFNPSTEIVREISPYKADDLFIGERAELHNHTKRTVAQSLWSEWKMHFSKAKKAPMWMNSAISRNASIVACTTSDKFIEKRLQALGPLQFDWAIVEEAGKCYLSEIIGPILLSRQALLIGDHHQLPPFRIKEAEKSLEYKMEKSSQIKALNAELNLTDWLTPFASLHDILEGSGSTHQLQSQWRLPESISDMIGSVFYGSKFDHPGWDNSRNLPINDFPEMVWMDTPLGLRDNNFLERSGDQRSMMNPGEINRIVEALKKINHEITPENVAILTPYNGQKYSLIKKLELDPDTANFAERVHTVDEFQGKEADLVLISLVRNNLNTIAGRRWGFLLDAPRLNVMFSRAKRQMIVVGCSEFVRQTGFDEENDHLLRVLNWIERDGGIKA